MVLSQEKDEEKDLYLVHDEHESPLPLTVTSRVLYMLGDIASGPAYRFTQWLDLVRKRSATYGSSGFPHRLHRIDDMVTRLTLSLTFCQVLGLLIMILESYEYIRTKVSKLGY
jgi:hypothetical protein